MRFPHGTINSLLTAADHFADLYPGIAGRLGSVTANGRLERVRRGIFALGGAILDKMSELDDESYSALATTVDAALARPFPAATIVEMTTEGERHQVPAGAEVIGKGEVRFRLVSDLTVAPLIIESVRATGASLQFEIASTEQSALKDVIGDELRVYVDGPRERALLLVMHLLQHAVRIKISPSSSGTRSEDLSVIPYGERPEDMLAPEVDGPPNLAGLFREYFLLPEKFAFFILRGRAFRSINATSATITVELSVALPAGFSLASDALKTNCVPVVNLFKATSEPQTFGPGASSFRVHVAGLPRARASVYEIISATATPRYGGGPPIHLPAVRRFAADPCSSEFPYAYSARRRAMLHGTEPALIIALTSPRGTRPLLDAHVISLDVLATNAACNLAPGEICNGGPGVPSTLRVRNLLPTSLYIPAPTGPELAIRAFMRGAIPRSPLFALKSSLFSQMAPDTLDSALFRANMARIEAIQELNITCAEHEDGTRLTYQQSVAVDESPFAGVGDAALFVRLLQEAFAGRVAINGSCRTIATCKKTGLLVRWPSSNGRHPRPHQHPCAASIPATGRATPQLVPAALRPANALTFDDVAPLISRYDFFEAARILEHIAATNGEARGLRFGHAPGLAYPTTDVAELSLGKDVRLRVRLLGLLGTASPLAASSTEEVLQNDDDGLLRAFYDVLQHPLASCLYKAWQSRAIEGGFDLLGRDPMSQVLRSLAGVDATTQLSEEPLPGMVALGLADYLRQPHAIDLRSAEHLLQRLLPWPISLEPNIRRITILGPDETARLGRSKLGVDFVYGEERENFDGAVCLHVGPIDDATYERLMPGGDFYSMIERLTNRISDGKLIWMLEVRRSRKAGEWKLGAARLGVDSYYESDASGAPHVRVPLLEDADAAVREFVKPTDGDRPC